MCGISGILHFDSRMPVRHEDVRTMTELIQHRGPDDCGFYLNENVGLGFRRLSIIDLESGHQPMTNEDGSLWIVFNGEIYNHQELRSHLQKKGHIFRTKSDTETIIHLYEEYGKECVTKLRGMFAFAIWNEKDKTIFCARDRFGIKPFFYYLDQDRFLFGSEIKCITSQMKSNPPLSPKMLDYYLAYGYSSEEDTLYQGIKKLKPGHILETGVDRKTRSTRYWEINYLPDHSKTEEEWCEILEAKLSEAVKSHLMSDVPLGAFLSGGIDSSAVVAHMAKHSSTPVKTFSIGFKEEAFNELVYARQVAKLFGTEHHEQVLEPESVSLLPKLINMYDEPFADSSAIPTYYVSKFAREFVTVVLSGDGGDELFAGYNKYQKLKYFRDHNLLPDAMSEVFWGGLHKLIPNSVKGKGATYYLAKPKAYLPAYQSIWHMNERRQLYGASFWEEIKGASAEAIKIPIIDQNNKGDFLFSMQTLDMKTYMVDDILTKVDRASMHNSLEVRVPLLDHEFAELTFRIPSDLKLKGKIKKYIFKKSLQDHLPKTVLSHKKQGFGVPLRLWFKEDLKEYVNDHLLNSNSLLYDYLNPNFVSKIVHGHHHGMRDFNHKIWSLIVLDQWLSIHNAAQSPQIQDKSIALK